MLQPSAEITTTTTNNNHIHFWSVVGGCQHHRRHLQLRSYSAVTSHQQQPILGRVATHNRQVACSFHLIMIKGQDFIVESSCRTGDAIFRKDTTEKLQACSFHLIMTIVQEVEPEKFSLTRKLKEKHLSFVIYF